MRAVDIENYSDMEKFIKLELSRQTQTKRTASIELPVKFFYKLLKLIQFYLKNDSKEREAKKLFDENLKIYYVRINKVYTEVKRIQ